ncbi:MAG: hypothetical protein GF418_16325 [Chitinivibrionales bacterium]|nr:hypothetical protein [Chitinivibrionales bacterium]MBD3397188.1 hypothetical protein [Chitinivibrionales bacterium]
MTGIAGMFGRNASTGVVADMLEIVRHRGPDATHLMHGRGYVLGCCQANLGSKRSDSYVGGDKEGIVFDGHIYNTTPGYMTDAEILLDLSRRYGKRCLSHIDGTYAVAIADEDELMLGRDHVGTRSIFYGTAGGTTYFASELKALKPYADTVAELQPGTVYSSRKGVSQFEMIREKSPPFKTVDKGKKVLRRAIIDATERRMRDQAVGGVALGGGLDSSIITAVALQCDPGLHLFTVGLGKSPDIKNARLVADHLGARKRHHVRIVPEKEVAGMVRDAIWHLESFEEDCVKGCIATMLASGLASEHTNCCLCGEGADELFGGYHVIKQFGRKRRAAVMNALATIAYGTGLRRLDRGWLANSVNYRTPFLDTAVLGIADRMPVEWKVHGREQTEKWILREAFRDMLPAKIVSRSKQSLATGTSIDAVTGRIAARHVSPGDFARATSTRTGFKLNSPAELWFYQMFKELFPEDSYELQVRRWNPVRQFEAAEV